ncbi:GNAT family N-acetyltransferase [Alkaliphilus serpentinus]|nr:GNAT family N-acetyltransferase [Alkaliphilus serpentinus]
MIIRLIEKKDFGEWLKLRYDLWPYHTLSELEDEMKEIFEEIDIKPVFFAEDKGIIYGFIELSIRDSAPGCLTNIIGFIEGWYVKPEFRKLGKGKMLVEMGEQWAISKGCKEMASDTTERYPDSPVAHVALGYEEVSLPLHYKKDLL